MWTTTSDLSFGFCKQKTAYGVRISDGSSDVCSSDLLNATSASGGAKAASSMVVTLPAKNEPTAASDKAAPALPLRAIWCPSSTVTTADVSPGRLTRMAVVEPTYCVT